MVPKGLRVILYLLVSIAVGTSSTFGGKIAFTRSQDIWADIFVMNLDGSGLTRLSSPGNVPIDHSPAWSPDGRRIAFVSSGINDPSDIFTMDADGSDRVQLTDGGPSPSQIENVAPAWSPDGSKIAFISTRSGRLKLYVMDRDGSNVTAIPARSPLNIGLGCCSPPSWSPDGKQLAVILDISLAVFSLETLETTILVQYGWYEWEIGSPSWSPDGSTIAFAKQPYEGFYGSETVIGDIWLIDVHTLAQRNLTKTPNVMEDSPSWASDGQSVLFTVRDWLFYGPSGRLHTIQVDGSGRKQLTFPAPLRDDSSPSAGPDASVSGRLTTTDGRGVGRAKITISDGTGFERTTVTSSLGFYTLERVPMGAEYLIRAVSKRYRFEDRKMTIDDFIKQVDFVAFE